MSFAPPNIIHCSKQVENGCKIPYLNLMTGQIWFWSLLPITWAAYLYEDCNWENIAVSCLIFPYVRVAPYLNLYCIILYELPELTI